LLPTTGYVDSKADAWIVTAKNGRNSTASADGRTFSAHSLRKKLAISARLCPSGASARHPSPVRNSLGLPSRSSP